MPTSTILPGRESGTEARSCERVPLQHGELMLERENFRRELEPRADRGPKQASRATNSAVILSENRISLVRNRNGNNTFQIISRDKPT
jgi:hypothetical protein